MMLLWLSMSNARQEPDLVLLDLHTPAATIATAIEAVARSGGPARIMDGSRLLGVVDHQRLLAVVAGLRVKGAPA